MNRSKLKKLIDCKHGSVIHDKTRKSFLQLISKLPFFIKLPNDTYIHTLEDGTQTLGLLWDAAFYNDVDFISIIIHNDETYDFEIHCDECILNGTNVHLENLTKDDAVYLLLPRPFVLQMTNNLLSQLRNFNLR